MDFIRFHNVFFLFVSHGSLFLADLSICVALLLLIVHGIYHHLHQCSEVRICGSVEGRHNEQALVQRRSHSYLKFTKWCTMLQCACACVCVCVGNQSVCQQIGYSVEHLRPLCAWRCAVCWPPAAHSLYNACPLCCSLCCALLRSSHWLLYVFLVNVKCLCQW